MYFFAAAEQLILQSQIPKGMKKSDMATQMREALAKHGVEDILITDEDMYDADKKQPPRFITQIQTNETLVEMQEYKFDCQLIPVGDPHMKVEWFFNGKPLPYSKY